MNLNDFPSPNSIQSSFKGASWWKSAIAITTTWLSTVLIMMRACFLEARFTWTKILSSAPSILHGTKDDIPRPALLVTTLSFTADTTTLSCISLRLQLIIREQFSFIFATSQERHPVCLKKANTSNLSPNHNSTFFSRTVFQTFYNIYPIF